MPAPLFVPLIKKKPANPLIASVVIKEFFLGLLSHRDDNGSCYDEARHYPGPVSETWAFRFLQQAYPVIA